MEQLCEFLNHLSIANGKIKKQMLNYRLVIFILATLFGIIFSIPSFTQSDSGKKISLGLDLQGWLHMLLGVEVDKAVSNKIKTIASTIKYFTDNEQILIEDLTIEETQLSFVLLDGDEKPKLDKMLADIKGLNITDSDNLV